MNKTHIYILIAVMAVLLGGAMSSCSETSADDGEFDNWKSRNEQYFSRVYSEAKAKADAGDASWKVLRSTTLNDDVAKHDYDHVVVQVLNQGTGSGCPFYTDSVKVHYSGRLMPSATYPQGMVFDQSWTGDYNLATMQPRNFAVSGVVSGFATAMQNMHIGDRWVVTIPYQLGYGSATNAGQAYSTLVFDITLVGYFRVEAPAQAMAKDGSGAVPARGHWVYE